MMFLSKNWYFSVQKAKIYYTFNKSHHNSFILLVFSHVANFRYVANFRFLTLLDSFSVLFVTLFLASRGNIDYYFFPNTPVSNCCWKDVKLNPGLNNN